MQWCCMVLIPDYCICTAKYPIVSWPKKSIEMTVSVKATTPLHDLVQYPDWNYQCLIKYHSLVSSISQTSGFALLFENGKMPHSRALQHDSVPLLRFWYNASPVESTMGQHLEMVCRLKWKCTAGLAVFCSVISTLGMFLTTGSERNFMCICNSWPWHTRRGQFE